MPTRIELLKQAGFSDDEIGDWVSTERQQMQAAGHTDGEIDESLGITRPPQEVPPAFIERLKQGNWLYRILGTAGEYAQNYFGDEPLGFSPEHQRLLGKFGVIGDLTAAAGGPVDALLRSVPAGVGALGAGVGQAIEEAHDAAFGPGPYAKGKAARDFAQLAQIAALLSGAKGQKAGSPRAAPDIASGPVIELPRAEDFRNAAASISGASASYQTEQKLLRLWTEHGIHPNEVAADAMRDRAIAETARSDSDELPEIYVRGNRTSAPVTPQTEVPAGVVDSGQVAEGDLAAGPQRPADRGSPGHRQGDSVLPNASSDRERVPMEENGESSANPSAPAPASRIARSDDIQMYDPPPVRRRPFVRDYPGEVRTDDQGRLLEDIEGRPLGAKFIAGRRFAGQPDQSLSVKDLEAASTKLNIPFAAIGPLAFEKGVAGMFMANDKRRKPGGYIFLNNNFSLPDQNLTMGHEFGHAIDHFAGMFSKNLTPDEINELRSVYGTLRTSSAETFFRDPESFRYKPHQVNGELLAEGLRAYMANPNYFKMMAPKSAAKIREAVNKNPHLKRVIQFNSLLAAGLIGAGARNQDEDDR
jgi:hypothetical protein